MRKGDSVLYSGILEIKSSFFSKPAPFSVVGLQSFAKLFEASLVAVLQNFIISVHIVIHFLFDEVVHSNFIVKADFCIHKQLESDRSLWDVTDSLVLWIKLKVSSPIDSLEAIRSLDDFSLPGVLICLPLRYFKVWHILEYPFLVQIEILWIEVFLEKLGLQFSLILLNCTKLGAKCEGLDLSSLSKASIYVVSQVGHLFSNLVQAEIEIKRARLGRESLKWLGGALKSPLILSLCHKFLQWIYYKAALRASLAPLLSQNTTRKWQNGLFEVAIGRITSSLSSLWGEEIQFALWCIGWVGNLIKVALSRLLLEFEDIEGAILNSRFQPLLELLIVRILFCFFAIGIEIVAFVGEATGGYKTH